VEPTARHSEGIGWHAWNYPELLERAVELPYALSWLGHLHGTRVLNVAPGPFLVLPQVLQFLNYRVTASDLAPAAKWVVKDDACNSSLPSNTFDGVFCISAITHLYDIDAAFRHIYRVTKPGGLIVLTSGYHPERRVKSERGFIGRPGAPSKRGSTTICGADISRWILSYAAVPEGVRYWRGWSDGWYAGARLPSPVECEHKSAQLIGIALRKEH